MVLLGCLAVALSACVPSERVVSRDMAEYDLPYLGREAVFTSVADWRSLNRPTDAMRDYFGGGGTYLVVAAQRDRVTLVVWKTDSPYGQPFDGGEKATGHGCVTLSRAPGQPGSRRPVRSVVVPCPDHLGPQPDGFQTSWGRDANALQAVQGVLTGVDFRTVAYVLPEPYQSPVRRTRAEMLAMIRGTPISRRETLTVEPAARQPHGRLVARLSAAATAADAVDTRRSVVARSCGVVDVRLNGTLPPGQSHVVTAARCR
ncbi:hypothetical protein SAMN05443575_4217 [Jatrophihabitans endophyticus]|uniref:Uncharacterized protein n=1 Tax=Jatrophihabitans endophyticus TaxID=1206085 RepID=A0A1M5UH00_9ACTN|nr:hypothetical protein SAMN05443575_4217 [Jatrophihabitans endophyticus]